ncbi:MAG TPA: helix-turn-helix domain-containing protein [Minicystis sp.]|nr:helix-turn-helix domain-containing protein [Minicystis sp.]
MHFGATLRLLRTDAGVSLRALASEVGVSSAYLSRVENGHDAVPTPDRLVAIARVLHVPPALLIELAHKVTPVVAAYLERVPAAAALFVEIARRELTGAQIARIKAFVDAEFPREASPAATASGRLSQLLTPEHVVLRLSCSHFDDLVDVAAARLARAAPPSAAVLAESILRREAEASSAIGEGIAVPHAVVADAPAGAVLVTLARPLRVPTPDGQPLRACLVLRLGKGGADQLALLAQAAKLASPGVARDLETAERPEKAIERLEVLGL